jgi:transposase-like protein
VAAAKAFLRKAMRQQRLPTKITLDAYAASHRAVADQRPASCQRVRVRSSKYLNNTIEQDHRRVKLATRPYAGTEEFQNGSGRHQGIELAEKIKKGQFKIGKLCGPTATMPEIWRAALVALADYS